MSKKGRKTTSEPYFGVQQEEAVIRFLKSDDYIERNQIYNSFLRKPIDKMIESIIRRYKLYRKNYSFEELHSDTLSFLITKADKFNIDSGKKAYSFYGTICKNYILGLLIKDEKSKKQTLSFEDSLSAIEEREEFTYQLDDYETDLTVFIKEIANEIDIQLQKDENETESKKKLTVNERKVGLALVEILNNWKNIFISLEGGSKYHKNLILATIRDYTNLSTKDIRASMKRFLKLYDLLKDDNIKNS